MARSASLLRLPISVLARPRAAVVGSSLALLSVLAAPAIVCSPCAPGASRAAFADEAAPVRARVDGGRLEVTSRGASVMAVLQEFTRASGVAVVVEPGLEAALGRESLTAVMAGVSLEEGLRRLLPERHLVLVYAPEGLAEVRIYASPPAASGPAVDAAPARDPRAKAKGRPPGPPPPVGLERLARLRAERDVPSPPPEENRPSLESALRALEPGRDPAATQEALDRLTELEVVPVDPLLKFAASAADAELRTQALEMLTDHGAGDARIRDLLVSLAAGDRDEDVRDAARDMLQAVEARGNRP